DRMLELCGVTLIGTVYLVHFVGGFVFFFFQAEDGIRDWSVTGVQTCALPICPAWFWNRFPAILCNGEQPRRFCLWPGYARRRVEIGRASCRERGEISVGGV